MNRRKGTPCGCDSDPCGCSPKNHCMKTINNVSPDPNGDFWINPGVGIRVVETQYGIEITNLIDPDYLIAGANIELTPTDTHLEIALKDDISIGNLNVAGDIIQQGSSYETHAQQIFTVDDYIIMRDGAVGGLASGSYSGFQVKLYDGVNDGRLVIDNTGTARVGDVGDEQPLLTRSESNALTNGQLFKWDSTNSKAVGVNIDATPTDGSANPVSSDGVYDALATKMNITPVPLANISIGTNFVATYLRGYQIGKIVVVTMYQCTPTSTGVGLPLVTGLPQASGWIGCHYNTGTSSIGNIWIDIGGTSIYCDAIGTGPFWYTFWYIAE